MSFHVGQRVVCVKHIKSQPRPGETFPVKGNIYTVRGIIDCRPRGVGLYLHEIVNPPIPTWMGLIERAYSVDGFRPVIERKTDISVFTRLLTPTDKVSA